MLLVSVIVTYRWQRKGCNSTGGNKVYRRCMVGNSPRRPTCSRGVAVCSAASAEGCSPAGWSAPFCPPCPSRASCRSRRPGCLSGYSRSWTAWSRINVPVPRSLREPYRKAISVNVYVRMGICDTCCLWKY